MVDHRLVGQVGVDEHLATPGHTQDQVGHDLPSVVDLGAHSPRPGARPALLVGKALVDESQVKLLPLINPYVGDVLGLLDGLSPAQAVLDADAQRRLVPSNRHRPLGPAPHRDLSVLPVKVLTS